MKKENFTKSSDKDLLKALQDARNELRSFRFSVSGSKTRNIKVGLATRKKIARILTEIRKREIASVKEK